MSDALAGLGVERRSERVSVPGAVVESVYVPRTRAEVAEVVSAAAAAGAGLLILGGRTRLDCAGEASSIQHALSLEGLSGIDEFEPDEGVLHARAGTPIEEIRAAVAREGWELPLDSPGPRTTVGGTIASAVTGPRAQAFGAVSDAILGLDVVGGDGVASKCGGRVVKNVTGYDLAKLYCGSFGSLAVVTGAWLRLRPRPACRETLRARVPSERESFESIRALARLASVRALVWCEAAGDATAEVVVELGGSEEGVRHVREQIGQLLGQAGVELETLEVAKDAAKEDAAKDDAGKDEAGAVDRLREARTTAGVGPDEVVLRARVLGSRCEALRREIRDAGLRVSIDPGRGVIHGRGPVALPSALLGIRARAERAGGFVMFERLPESWRSEIAVFGSLGGTESLVATLKAKFDPAGILNPGRFACPSGGGRRP